MCSSWWLLFLPRNCVMYISTYAFFITVFDIISIYIHRECRSVVLKLYPITVYRSVLRGVCGSCAECHLPLSSVSPIVSCSMIRHNMVLVTIDIHFEQHDMLCLKWFELKCWKYKNYQCVLISISPYPHHNLPITWCIRYIQNNYIARRSLVIDW